MFPGYSHSANQPLEVLHYIGEENSHENLFIFLRGLGGSHRSFAKEGMVDATWKKDIDFDMAAPNSHFGYYSERTLIERLRLDMIVPAKRKGYKKIWLVGASMGGLGSLLYTREHPKDIDGIFLISPFVGYNKIIKEIISQGGLEQWHPGDYSPDKDWQRMLWHWVKAEVKNQNTSPVYLGFGSEDKYAAGQELLSSALPADHIIRMKGGHNYDTFNRLWLNFLNRGVFLAPQV